MPADIGTDEILDQLEAIAPTKAVYGNIDGQSIRKRAPEPSTIYCRRSKILDDSYRGAPQEMAERDGYCIEGRSTRRICLWA